MVHVLIRRWSIVMAVAVVGLLAAACQIPRVPVLPLQTVTATAAAADSTATDAPMPIDTPEPGPTPTATPEPLAEPDTARSNELVEEGQALFLASDLQGAEVDFIDAVAADSSNVSALIHLTNLYQYWPHYWQQALTVAEAAAQLAPEDPTVLAYLAWAQQGAHHFDDAWATVLHATELGPDNAIAHAAAADILSSVYQMDDAYANAQKAVELDSQSSVAWATLGSIAFSLEYWDEAGDAYDKALDLEPDFFAWHLLRARYELNVTGDVQTARDLLEPALATQADHPWIISFMVDAAVERNEWEQAETECQRLFVFNQPATPYPDAYSCMAGVLILQERYAEAESYQAIAESIATSDRLDITLLRMRLYNEQEECDKSRELAQSWLDQRAYSVLAKRMIGVSYLCDENYDQAVNYFEQAVQDLPRSVSDARLLANAYARDNKASEAVAAINRVKSFATMDPLYYQGLYEVNIFLGQTKEALKAAQRWQVLRPESTEARSSIALVQLFDGNTDAAQSAALDAIDAGDVSSTIYAVLGETYSRQQRYEDAEKYLLMALDREKDHFLAHNFITTLYLIQGECDKAEPHLLWLKENTTDPERAKQYDDLLQQCRDRKAQFSPDAADALDDDAALAEAETQLKAAGVDPRSVRFAEDGAERNLVVAYASELEAASAAFGEQEREISREMARLLTRITSLPTGVIVLSGAGNQPQNITYVTARAAFLWRNGDLTDEEFEQTWYQQSAENLGQ
ncbi:MAG: hypothetical protein R3C14_23870 [Caldilineaceae bacterium]